jgi:hypothetical protein
LNQLTGVDVTTRVAMESADLGILRWDDQRNAVAAMFGDNFEFWRMGGEWQSPSIVMYDNDLNVLGVPTKDGIDPNGRRKQLWDYPHGNPDYSTILPCDFIRVGEWWYVAAMVTAGLGREKRTVFWKSRDLVDWQKTNPYVSLVHLDENFNHVGHPGNTMLTFDQIGDYVYIFGTNGLQRDRPIYLWRNKAEDFPGGLWEPWGMDHVSWAWGVPNESTPILPGRYGELCFRYMQGNCVLSFFDVDNYSTSAITVVNPTDAWPSGNRVDYASGQDFSQLYGGYIAPASELNKPNGMRFAVSQWNTATNDPYWVVRFDDTLQAMGPLVAPTPKPVPTPKPTPIPPVTVVTVPGEQMTPQELYELLLRELSASGSTKITTPEGENITLRAAIEQIFWKERGLHGLEGGRPRSPKTKDDQLGHVLSMRAENLFNQALLLALADKAGIDSAKLYRQIQDGLK